MTDDVLAPGDLIWVDFNPAFGHEQSGRRPALVMSASSYNRRSSFVLACPVTRSLKPWPFHVPLPSEGKITGAVIADQIKSIDRGRIVSPPIDRLSETPLLQIRAVLMSIVGFDFSKLPE